MTFSFTKLATTALTGLAALGFASASYATPTRTTVPEGSLDAHAVLVEAIEAQGVDFIVNHDFCQERPSVNGFYSSGNRVLVVCNDLYTEENTNPEWTANDLDTLRHEAQHLIQDCMVGGLADSTAASCVQGSDWSCLWHPWCGPYAGYQYAVPSEWCR